jgi:hypothetical protein
MAELNDEQQQNLFLHAEEQSQVTDPYAVEIIGKLLADHTGMAGRLPVGLEFTIHPALEQRIQAAVGLGG